METHRQEDVDRAMQELLALGIEGLDAIMADLNPGLFGAVADISSE
jgi:hypothetical protein